MSKAGVSKGGVSKGQAPKAGPSSRVVTVEAVRLVRWVAGFGTHHGEPSVEPTDDGMLLTAPDGASARIAAPFPPWPADPGAERTVEALAASVGAPRRVAMLLVRRGGYGCALVVDGRVTESKVGNRYVQSRTAAGGWSQHRFARRRDNQADALAHACADVAARLLLPALPLDALVTGGDRPLVDQVLAGPQLAALAALPAGPHLPVGDPRIDVLKAAAASLTAVRITLTTPVIKETRSTRSGRGPLR